MSNAITEQNRIVCLALFVCLPAIMGTCDSLSRVPLLLPTSSANQSPPDQEISKCLLDTEPAPPRQHRAIIITCWTLLDTQHQGFACCSWDSLSLTTSALPFCTLPTRMGLLLSLVQVLPAAGPVTTVSVMLFDILKAVSKSR